MTTITQGHDLLREIADVIEAQPERHYQQSWQETSYECGTTACVAGWACILGTEDFYVRGNKYIPRKDVVRSALRRYAQKYSIEFPRLQRDYLEGGAERLIDGLSGVDYYIDTAAELLGLDRLDSWALFESHFGPLDGHTVPSALRAIADGADIEDVWGFDDEDDDDDA